MYEPKLPPRPYQEIIGPRTRFPNLRRFLLAWEQGVGKSKPMIDVAGHLYTEGKIDLLIVLAPNGVHFNWTDHELPKHLNVPYRAHAFDNPKDSAKNKRHAADMAWALEDGPHLKVLTFSYDALRKDSLFKVDERGRTKGQTSGRLAEIVRRHRGRVMIVGDELVSIKTDGGKTSNRALALAWMCEYRWGADGTPVDNGPFDLYAQMRFLEPDYWARFGIGSYTAFQHRFGIFKDIPITIYDADPKTGEQRVRTRFNPETRENEPVRPKTCVAYKDLGVLNGMLRGALDRLTKQDAGLDLPPKVYIRQPFELTPKQREVYDKFKRDQMVELEGRLITAQHKMTLDIRLAQLTCGYLPTDIDDPENYNGESELIEVDPGNNPRLEILGALCGTLTTQGIIWVTFNADKAKIADFLGRAAVVYDGRNPREAIGRWRAGDAQWIIGNTTSGLAVGHTLVEGDHAIYFQNLYRYGRRLQSEDREHRIGQTKTVTYYDIEARRTVDGKRITSLIKKDDVAVEVLGDDPREWIR